MPFRSHTRFLLAGAALCFESACSQTPAAPQAPESSGAALEPTSAASEPLATPEPREAPAEPPQPNPTQKPGEPLPLKPGAGMGTPEKPGGASSSPAPSTPSTDQEAIKRIAEAAQDCFSRALSLKSIGDKTSGKSLIEVHVEGGGSVSDVLVGKSAGFGDEFDKCVITAAKSQKFPVSPKSERVFSLPLEFAAGK